ncbi:MAG: hypothetical protein ACRCZI_08415 [Cetobacterium sp.]
MVYNYLYSYDDFTSSEIINPDEIQSQIIALDLQSGTLLYINTGFNVEFNTDIVELVFTTQLNSQDLDILNDFIDNYVGTAPKTDKICKFSDIKTPGTNGGTFEKDIWVTRTLNTTEGNVDFATLSNNIITLEPGSYIITIRSPSCNSGNNQIRLKNLTNNTSIIGQNAFSNNNLMTYSELHQMLKIDVQSQFKVEHICSNKTNVYGLGRASGYAVSEVYTVVVIQRYE